MNLDTRSYSQQLRVLSYPHNVLGSKAIALLLFPPSNMISPALGGLTLPRRQTSFLGILLASHSLPLLVPSSWGLAALLFLQAHACLRPFAPAFFFFFSFLDSFPQTAMIHLFLNNSDCIFCEAFLAVLTNTCLPSSLYFPVFPRQSMFAPGLCLF